MRPPSRRAQPARGAEPTWGGVRGRANTSPLLPPSDPDSDSPAKKTRRESRTHQELCSLGDVHRRRKSAGRATIGGERNSCSRPAAAGGGDGVVVQEEDTPALSALRTTHHHLFPARPNPRPQRSRPHHIPRPFTPSPLGHLSGPRPPVPVPVATNITACVGDRRPTLGS